MSNRSNVERRPRVGRGAIGDPPPPGNYKSWRERRPLALSLRRRPHFTKRTQEPGKTSQLSVPRVILPSSCAGGALPRVNDQVGARMSRTGWSSIAAGRPVARVRDRARVTTQRSRQEQTDIGTVVELLRDRSAWPLAPGRLGQGRCPPAEPRSPPRGAPAHRPPPDSELALGGPRAAPPVDFRISLSSMTMMHYPLSLCCTATHSAAGRANFMGRHHPVPRVRVGALPASDAWVSHCDAEAVH